MNSFERVKLIKKTMEQFSFENKRYIFDGNLFEILANLIDEVVECEEEQDDLKNLSENLKEIADELHNMREFFEWEFNQESTAAAVADLSDSLSILAECATSYLTGLGEKE